MFFLLLVYHPKVNRPSSMTSPAVFSGCGRRFTVNPPAVVSEETAAGPIRKRNSLCDFYCFFLRYLLVLPLHRCVVLTQAYSCACTPTCTHTHTRPESMHKYRQYATPKSTQLSACFVDLYSSSVGPFIRRTCFF